MKNLLQRFRLHYFPPISRRRAIRIARNACGHDLDFHCILNEKPEKVLVYNHPSEPCWYIFSPWNDGKDGTMIRESCMLMVSKVSGRVLYHGSAGDEG